MRLNPTLIISIVNYKSEKSLYSCLNSVLKYPPPVSYKIIVTDNDPKDITESKITSNYSKVKYIKSDINLGFGKAHNYALENVNSKYLLILNPDTLIVDSNFWNILKIFDDPKIGICGPKIIDFKGQIEKSFTDAPHPWKGLVYYSFLDKYFPNNHFSKQFWYRNQSIEKPEVVGSVSGAALFITGNLWQRLRGFDENFFLYFEDTDLCLRAIKAGKKIYYCPEFTLSHQGGGSTQSKTLSNKIFQQSRYYFFKKHYSSFEAVILEMFLRPLEKISQLKNHNS